MKKKFSLLLTMAFLSLCLTGCGNNPKSIVQTFCSALPKQDFDKMISCFEEDMVVQEDFTDIYYDLSELGLDDFFASEAAGIKAKVTKQEIDEDNKDYATVTVQLEYPDYSEVLITALDAYAAEYAPYDISEIDPAVFVPLLQTQVSGTQTSPVSEELLFPCEKVEGKWVISYDYDVLERIGNVLSCNMTDAYMEYEFVYPDEDEDFWDEDSEDGDISDGDISDGDEFYEEDEFSEETMNEDDLYDYYTNLMDSVESSDAYLVLGGYTVDYDDEDYYIVTGAIYEYDIYAQWRAIVGTDGKFEAAHPDIYDALDNGLWDEEYEIYIPRDAAFSGVWPQNGGSASVSDIEQLLSSGQAFVYFEDEYGDASTVYKCATDYR